VRPVDHYPVVVKTEDLVVWLLEHTSRFPRVHRGGLTARIEGCSVDLLAYLAKAAGNSHRRNEWLCAASEELDALRILVRLSVRLRFLSQRQYGFFAEASDEIGRMLGGWLKTAPTS